jgi:BlaI family transcriptional regulator, penicillinase repressor
MPRVTRAPTQLRAPLSELERDIMEAVWSEGPSTVDAVHRRVAQRRDLKEATIRTIMRRLENKGYLHHRAVGRAYVYEAFERPQSLAARAVRQIIDRFCRGSIEELVSGMVEAKVLSKTDLRALEQTIRDYRHGQEDGAKKGRR